MRNRIHCALCALTVLTPLMSATVSAQEIPRAPPNAEAPSSAQPPQQAAPPNAPPPNIGAPGAGAKGKGGDPGMMGLPWPKTPEEASKTLSDLFALLATSQDRRQAGAIAVSIEKLWRLPGGDTANVLLDRGHNAAMKNELELAIKFLDAAVDLQPDYAEAWNRRAYVHYRMGNSVAALDDLRRVLALEPNHFRALDGMAKILTDVGEKKAALKAYQQLLSVHPNIEGAKEAAEELGKAVEGQGI